MNQYLKNNINAIFSAVKKVSPLPKPTLTKVSAINVTEVLKPNIAFCILETHKREIKKASLLFFFEDENAICITIRNTYQA